MQEQTKQELQNKLSGILTWLEESLKTAEGFVVEQTPLYIQELLAWNFWHSLIYFSTGFLALGIGGYAIKSLLKHARTQRDPLDCYVGASLLAIATSVGTLIPMLNNLDWLKILLAPRVWLLDHAVSKLGSL